MPLRTVAVACFLCLVGGGAWAINKCVDASGRTSFQDEPCAAGQQAKEYTVTPPTSGVNPTAGSKPTQPSARAKTPAAAPVDAVKERPADCPSAEQMQQMRIEAESVALPLPIRNQKKQDFEALQQRCN